MPGADITAILANRKLRVAGPLPETKMFIKAARVIEGLSQITETTIDVLSHDRNLPLEKLVGQTHKVRIQLGDAGGTWREFVGTCIEASYVGLHEGYSFYTLEVRPWLWFLTKSSNNRIFQNLNAVDIIKKIFGERGFSDFTVTVQRAPQQRVYCVQYDETDYDFICRLMEEEGMYFFSTVKGGKDHLMIVDDAGAHSPVPGAATIDFWPREANFRRAEDHLFEWRGSEGVRSGKVTLRDYDFERPKADLTSVNTIAKGQHSYKNFERYRYSGRYRQTSLGDIYARIKMEAEACQHAMRTAVGNVRTLATGHTFTRKTEPANAAEDKQYLIVAATHMMQIEVQATDETQQITAQNDGRKGGAELPGTIKFEENNKDAYRCTLRALLKTVPFRAPLVTPWPQIPGILLARVTGPRTEEIYTDKYGRIKVQFHWDREGKNDENTTCWVRVVTQWSGKDWGLVSVPRIGQEVVIQFEDGDIDRPICTGMMYNAETMPPYALPGNMTQTGIKTRSTKKGGADNYHELVFEDKKDEEFIRMHSEKDFFQTIENNAVVSIGETKKDPGDLTTTIHHTRTETIKTGDLILKVETGNEDRYIKTNRTEKIDGDAAQEIKGNKTRKVTGNFEQETTGNSQNKVTGNLKEEVTGTIAVKGTGGITIESPASIELKVGGNTIKIDPSGITINGLMIKTSAQTMAEHSGSAMMTIKGGIVMIN